MKHREAASSLGAIAILSMAVVACVASAPPTAGTTGTTSGPGEAANAASPTDLPTLATEVTATPAPKTTAVAEVFLVAAIIDRSTQSLTRDQAAAVIESASQKLRALTPFTLMMTDYLEVQGGSPETMASSYLLTGRAPTLPNGIVIFSTSEAGAPRMGDGFSLSVAAPEGFQNAFVSPTLGSGQVYVAVVDYSRKYMPCGYGSAESPQSALALDGECGNQPGKACIEHNGYSMCADALPHLYASTPEYYPASTMVHMLLHPFAPEGDRDHYSTPECSTRMGYPVGFFDLQESQYYSDLCPFVYENFTTAYQP